MTERGEFFSWGSDRAGQCGHGSSRLAQLLPRRVEALTGVRARSASAGGSHSLVVAEKGALYSFGHGARRQLGHGCVDEERCSKIVDALRHVRITAAAAGSHHSLALAENGIVFSWGSNNYGHLGVGQIGEDAPLPQRVEALSGLKVCSVAAASATSCALTSAGKLFPWGNGWSGKIGRGDLATQHAPRRVDALQGEWVVAVSAGVAHTIAVTRGGGMFGWGAANGLGLQDAAVSGDEDEDEDDACILFPCRYPQLSSVEPNP